MEITKEQILTKINEICEQRKWSLTNKFKEKFAEKILPNFNIDGEEINLDEKITDFEFTLETAYHSSNSALAEKAEKDKQTPTPQPPIKPQPKHIETTPQNGVAEQKVVAEIPEEYKQMLETFKIEQEQKAYAAKREEILKSVTGLNEIQKTAFKDFLNEFSPNVDADVNELANQYKASFTKIYGGIIPESTGVGGASGGNKDELEKAKVEMYNQIGKDLAINGVRGY